MPTSSNQPTPPIAEIDVLWITAGLGCDGDTIAMTAATQPSIEDLVLGGIPWIPKVNFHNPFLSYENGDEFLQAFHLAAEGRAGAFHPGGRRFHSRRDQQEGRLLGIASGPTQQPASPSPTCDWIDRLAPHAWAVDRGGNLRHLWRNPRHGGQSHRLHGACRIIWAGNGNRAQAFPSCAFPAVPFSPTTSWRRCSTCSTWQRAGRR